MLADRETNWTDQQKIESKLWLTKKIENGTRTKDYIKTILVDCKSGSGPWTFVDELQLILRQNPDQS